MWRSQWEVPLWHLVEQQATVKFALNFNLVKFFEIWLSMRLNSRGEWNRRRFSPEPRLATFWLPLVLPGSDFCSSHTDHIWVGNCTCRLFVGKCLAKGSLTSRRDCSCHRSPPTGQLLACHPPPGRSRENAKRRNVNKTHLVYQLHQATLHSSTGGMESLKHWPILKSQLN